MKGNLVFYTGLSKAPALTRITPAFARNCACFIRFLQTLRVGALRRALLFLATPRRVWPLLTTEVCPTKPYCLTSIHSYMSYKENNASIYLFILQKGTLTLTDALHHFCVLVLGICKS